MKKLGGFFLFILLICSPLLNAQEKRTGQGTLNLSDFSGGLNLKAYPTQLKNNEATLLVNAWWDKFGSLGRRKGYTHFSIPDSAMGINGLYRYYKQNDTAYLMVGGDTALYRAKNDSTSFVKIRGNIPSGEQFYFITYKDKVCGAIYNEYPFIYDGVSFESLGVRFDSAQIDTVYVADDYDCYPVIRIKGTKDWSTDQYSGYITCAYNAGNTEWVCDFILNNDDTSISLAGDAWDEGEFGEDWLYLYSVFYNRQPLFTAVMDSVKYAFCSSQIYDSTFSPANWFKNKLYWVEVEELLAGKQVFFVRDNPDTTYLQILDSIKTLVNSNYSVFQKVNYPAKYITSFHNRIFLAFDSLNGNAIYYSTTENPGDFPPTNFFTTFTNDGDVITGLMPLYNDQKGIRASPADRLIIFKQNNILATASNFIPYVVATGVGAIAPRSIVNVEGRFVGFAHTTGFYGTDGNTVSDPPLSEQIKPFWDNINRTAIDKIACGYYDRHIVCSVPYGTSTENDTCLIYNIDNKSWSTANISASVFANQWGLADTIKFLWGRPDSGFIQRYGVSDFDDGDTVVLSFKSKEFDNDITQRERFRELYVAYDIGTDSLTTLNFYKDFGSSATWTKSLYGTGKGVQRVPISTDIYGKTLAWGLTSKDPGITIGNVQIKFYLIGGF